MELYHDLLADFKGHYAYLKGPNGFSFISTFSDGGTESSNWTTFSTDWASEVSNMNFLLEIIEPADFRFFKQYYLVPDFDGTNGYYTGDDAWWAYWGDTVDGLFSM